MIQRKQTIFLLLAAVAILLGFTFPIASFQAKAALGMPVSGELNLVAKPVTNTPAQILNGEPVEIGQNGIIDTWSLITITIVVAVLAIGSIFLYKRRVLQMRVVSVAFLLSVVQIFLIFIWAVDAYVDEAVKSMACSDVQTIYGAGTWVVVAAALLLFLAQRAIRKDEEKVRAADRIR